MLNEYREMELQEGRTVSVQSTEGTPNSHRVRDQPELSNQRACVGDTGPTTSELSDTSPDLIGSYGYVAPGPKSEEFEDVTLDGYTLRVSKGKDQRQRQLAIANKLQKNIRGAWKMFVRFRGC
jgi:hypothetical protein